LADSSGAENTLRWSLLPAAQPVSVSPDDLAKRGPDFLEQEITERVRGGLLRWTMGVSVANPGDPTADPSKAWPEDRRAIEVDTLTVQQIEAERDGPCRDINFDPTVLPPGMRTSDNPFPATRSAAYAKSYDRRTGLSPNCDGRQAMIGGRQRFTLLQRLLHWLMAVCILAMLFIGVGMVGTLPRSERLGRKAAQFYSGRIPDYP
jgi:hypothetical protein